MYSHRQYIYTFENPSSGSDHSFLLDNIPSPRRSKLNEYTRHKSKSMFSLVHIFATIEYVLEL